MQPDKTVKRSTRDGFGDQLLESGAINPDIHVVTADLGEATRVYKFAKKYPKRYVDVGISEANAIGVAAGMAQMGKRVFVSSFAAFLTGRFDQIRASIAYPNIPVVLVGTHGGLAPGRDGAIHQALEDIALMRALPNMRVIQPATYSEAREITKWLCETKDLSAPVYLRLGRQDVCDYYNIKSTHIHIGATQGVPKAAFFVSGCTLDQAISAAWLVSAEIGAAINVIPVSVIKPLFEYGASVGMFYGMMRCQLVVTIEDHSIIGGLGSAIIEHMNDVGIKNRVLRIGTPDVFGESGDPKDLYEKYGLSAEKIAERILAWK